MTGKLNSVVSRSGKKEIEKVHLLLPEVHHVVLDGKEVLLQTGCDGRPHGHSHNLLIGQEEVLPIGEEVHPGTFNQGDVVQFVLEVRREQEPRLEAEALPEEEALRDGDLHLRNGTDIDIHEDLHHVTGLRQHIGTIEDHRLLMKIDGLNTLYQVSPWFQNQTALLQ